MEDFGDVNASDQHRFRVVPAIGLVLGALAGGPLAVALTRSVADSWSLSFLAGIIGASLGALIGAWWLARRSRQARAEFAARSR